MEKKQIARVTPNQSESEFGASQASRNNLLQIK